MNRPIRILLIEDNPGDARLLRETLAEAGTASFHLVHADRMSTGLEMLDRQEVDLVLLDLSLPDCQGLDALTLTHSKAPKVPIVLMTGLDDQDLALRAMRLGAQDYLVKGQVEGRDLVRSVRYALERKRLERLMRAHLATTQTLAESADLDEAAPEILRIFCEGLGWDTGALWLWDEKTEKLRCLSFWHPPRAPVPEFETATRAHIVSRGEGLIGKVCQNGKLAWIPDIAKAEHVIRAPSALKEGLKSALAFPLQSGSEIVGVLEFFARTMDPPDEAMLDTLAGVAGQVGQFVQRKQGEMALNSIEDRFRSVIDSANDAILIADSRGVILTWNRGAERIFGYRASEVVGQPITTIMPERYRELHRKGIARFLIGGESRVVGRTVELEGLRKGGEEFPIALSVSSWKTGDEVFLGGIIADITERQKVDRIKSEFISTVSHELRTPLTSILGSLGLVSGGAAGPLSAKATALVEIARKNSERLVRLINDILDVEKIESGRMDFHLRPIRLMSVVAGAIEATRAYAEKYGVAYQLEAGLPDAVVEADPDRLTQVITNLLSNATKFSPRGEAVSIAVIRRGPVVRISVADRGPGIPDTFRSRIFHRFAQADSSDSRQKGGTGLGLSISKAIIEKMGGRIGFDTAPNAGTRFYFDLPESHGKPVLDSSTNLRLRPRVLVCEAHAEAAAHVARVLGQAGIETDLARDAIHARAQLAQYRYQALTLDLKLPGGGGIAFVRELRENEGTRDLPVIMLSVSHRSEHGELEAGAIKVIDFLGKPVDKDRLLKAVRQAGAENRNSTPLVLHVEDDEDTRKIVGLILKSVARVTSVRSLREARDLLGRQPFDLVLLDPGMPDGAGLDLLEDLRGPGGRAIPVVVLSSEEMGEDLSRQVSAALVKTRTSNQDLLATIRSVLNQRGSPPATPS